MVSSRLGSASHRAFGVNVSACNGVGIATLKGSKVIEMMTDPHAHTQWVIVRDDADADSDEQFLSNDQQWGAIDSAMRFDTEADATNGAVTLCPPFMPGHAQPVTAEFEGSEDSEPAAP